MDFKITLPEQDIKPEVIEKRIRAMFSEDNENGGILAKSFIFIYLNQPSTVTEITTKISKYYKIDVNRGNTFRALKKLVDKGLLHTTTPGDITSVNDSERKEIEKEILTKYYKFLREIPDSFKRNFSNVNYYWISNGEGLRYIEWCCKILSFKCEAKI